MKVETGEWVKKAEADYATCLREWKVRKNPNYDAVCFHAHQFVEKYLKARLFEAGISFPKTHDLETLLKLCLPLEPLWQPFMPVFKELSVYAVHFRYLGEAAERSDAKAAVTDCKKIRSALRQGLHLR
jgi:HEPN domain-containing protein